MTSSYKITNIVKSKRNSVKANLLENGVVIGKIAKQANTSHYTSDYNIKFLSDASSVRFDTYCDCLSRSETIEALIGY